MIIDTLFSAVSAVLTVVFAALPTFSLSDKFAGFSGAASSLGRYLAVGDGILPVTTILTVMYDVYAILLPALIVYKIANWIWRHIPELWGFGPGAG